MALPSRHGGLSKGRISALIGLMLVSGCSNSILNKYQDMQIVNPATGKTYEQPIFQTLTMFMGETLCLVVFVVSQQIAKQHSKVKGRRKGQSSAAYTRLPAEDSGVVIQNNESYLAIDTADESHITLRGTEPHPPVLAHKSVVGPDELVPGAELPVEKQSEELSGTKAMLMWLPAIFDICGTTLMNVGLLWVPVSVYQMLRGALVLWVGLFSVLFLHRKLPAAQWCSLTVVMLGVAVVGFSNVIAPKAAPSEHESAGSPVDVGKAVIGALLVLFAQIFTASQFVVEEKIMTRYSVPPLRAVGLEGIFGLTTTAILMPILYFTIGRTTAGQGGYFDIVSGFHQTIGSPVIWGTSLCIACSIAFFNFSGLAVTKSVSATARSLIDTCRTVGIWAVSLFLGWEVLAPLQIVGFALLVYGTLLFNEVIPFPPFFPKAAGDDTIGKVFHSEQEFRDDEHARFVASGRGAPRTSPVVIRHKPANSQQRTIANESTPLIGSPTS